jgi:hypothetical protein
MAHTPGPWKISNDTIGSDYGDIARVHFQSSRNARGWDDRSVIAAAPELLDALHEAQAAITYMMHNDDCGGAANALESVASAIAKAEGRHHADA